jgi:hypothetical protein
MPLKELASASRRSPQDSQRAQKIAARSISNA